ncbi:hypothetical protein ACHAWT_000883 [Skeletonema menzelii]
MDQLQRAKKKLKTAHEKGELDYRKQTREQDEFETKLLERIRILDEKKEAAAAKYGAADVSDNDRVEINAGGKIIAARRGVLCQLKGTKFEALFSGRWDKKLLRDSSGRIFLDVNGDSFQAIVDYLNELVISGEDDIPTLPTEVGGEGRHMNYLDCYLKLFGIGVSPLMPDSSIITAPTEVSTIHQWLGEGDADGRLELIYRSSRDGLSNEAFHKKCDNVGATLVLIKTTSGGVLGGYTNKSWESNGCYKKANKSFLFALSGFGEGSPCKMRLENKDDSRAVYHNRKFGPTFGEGKDICVNNAKIYIKMGKTYEKCPIQQLKTPLSMEYIHLAIKEMEVFAVSDYHGLRCQKKFLSNNVKKAPVVDIFTNDINEAINEKWEALHELEMDVLSQEVLFEDEEHFVDSFADGNKKDLITLDVSGTIMVTKRATLQIIEGSVLAQQFDDSKWTEQGSSSMRVKEWSTAEVCNWVRNIAGVQEDISNLFEMNGINGSELLALDKDGLKMLGVDRVGTTCLLLKEIKLLEQKSQDVSTLIEHSPYCFGKILDYLRMKRLHSIELMQEPLLPSLCESQQKRFEKVVKYYFPGESSKVMLGGADSMSDEAEENGEEWLKRAIIAYLRSLRRTERGHNFGTMLADFQLRGLSATKSELRLAVEDLSNEGHIFTTIDEDHFDLVE